MNLFVSNSALGAPLLQDFSNISFAVSGSRREAEVQMAELPESQRAAEAQLCSVVSKWICGSLALLTHTFSESLEGHEGPSAIFKENLWLKI